MIMSRWLPPQQRIKSNSQDHQELQEIEHVVLLSEDIAKNGLLNVHQILKKTDISVYLIPD